MERRASRSSAYLAQGVEAVHLVEQFHQSPLDLSIRGGTLGEPTDRKCYPSYSENLSTENVTQVMIKISTQE